MAEVKKQDKRIHAIADAIRPFVTVEEKKFVIKDEARQAAVDAFNAEQGEKKPQISLDLMKSVDEFYNDLEPALIHATGNIGVDAMKADADIAKLEGTVNFGTTDFVLHQMREYKVRNPQFGKNDDAPEFIEKSGRPVIKRDCANGGAAYKRAIDAVCEYAGDVL